MWMAACLPHTPDPCLIQSSDCQRARRPAKVVLVSRAGVFALLATLAKNRSCAGLQRGPQVAADWPPTLMVPGISRSTQILYFLVFVTRPALPSIWVCLRTPSATKRKSSVISRQPILQIDMPSAVLSDTWICLLSAQPDISTQMLPCEIHSKRCRDAHGARGHSYESLEGFE